MKFIFSVILMTLFNTQAFSKLPTVESVDVSRYVGKWYAISALPQFFTRKCLAQTAEYAIRDQDSITVLNTCLKKNNETKTISGVATIKNRNTNADLEVVFDNFWTKLFRVRGEYLILKLATDYSVVMVGSSDLKSLWIMSRSPYLEEETLKEYVEHAKKLGFDTDALELQVYN